MPEISRLIDANEAYAEARASVADGGVHEQGINVIDQRDDVAAGDVAVVDDREARAAEHRPDVHNGAGRDGGTDRPAVKQAGERQVVDIARAARDLLDAFFAKDAATDRFSRAKGHRARL